MAVLVSHRRVLDTFLKELMKFVDVTYLGKLNYMLGIQFIHDEKLKTVKLTQRQYICTLLQRFQLTDAKGQVLPLSPGTIV